MKPYLYRVLEDEATANRLLLNWKEPGTGNSIIFARDELPREGIDWDDDDDDEDEGGMMPMIDDDDDEWTMKNWMTGPRSGSGGLAP